MHRKRSRTAKSAKQGKLGGFVNFARGLVDKRPEVGAGEVNRSFRLKALPAFTHKIIRP
jgi:hypothetical protein